MFFYLMLMSVTVDQEVIPLRSQRITILFKCLKSCSCTSLFFKNMLIHRFLIYWNHSCEQTDTVRGESVFIVLFCYIIFFKGKKKKNSALLWIKAQRKEQRLNIGVDMASARGEPRCCRRAASLVTTHRCVQGTHTPLDVWFLHCLTHTLWSLNIKE